SADIIPHLGAKVTNQSKIFCGRSLLQGENSAESTACAGISGISHRFFGCIWRSCHCHPAEISHGKEALCCQEDGCCQNPFGGLQTPPGGGEGCHAHRFGEELCRLPFGNQGAGNAILPCPDRFEHSLYTAI